MAKVIESTVKTADPSNPDFIREVKKLSKGDTLKLNDKESLVLEYDLADTTSNYEKRQNFPFHQRIFEPGVILRKEGSNARIFISSNELDAVK